MSAVEASLAARQSKRFLFLYALAVAGGAVAYVPFLTIILPIKATMLWGGNALAVLAYAAFAGAIAASVANILFGWLSDRGAKRRPWIILGMLLSCTLLPFMQYASTPVMLIVLIVSWQFGLNMMLAPLAAWAGDCVPDSQKGLLGSMLAFAPALGALSGALVTLPGITAESDRLILVALLVILMVTPVLILGRPVQMPQLMTGTSQSNQAQKNSHSDRSAVISMWMARLLVQIAEASLFAFLLLWFRSVAPRFDENDSATIFAAVLGLAVIATFIVGQWSDRTDRPILPLGLCACIAAAGLLMMAIANSLSFAIAGYVVFGVSSSIFLALHSSQTLRVLPAPRTRGRDLGLFNLTNTVPSLIMPWLTLAMVPAYGFDALFILLAGLATVAAILLLTLPRRLMD